jgi:hypothetical protein
MPNSWLEIFSRDHSPQDLSPKDRPLLCMSYRSSTISEIAQTLALSSTGRLYLSAVESHTVKFPTHCRWKLLSNIRKTID